VEEALLNLQDTMENKTLCPLPLRLGETYHNPYYQCARQGVMAWSPLPPSPISTQHRAGAQQILTRGMNGFGGVLPVCLSLTYGFLFKYQVSYYQRLMPAQV
jgi:hypothetical protein